MRSFLRQREEAPESLTGAEPPDLTETLAKKRKVKLAVAGPSSYSKYDRALGLFMTSIDIAITQMSNADVAMEKWKRDNKDRTVPKEMASYARAVEVNQKLATLWRAGAADPGTASAALALVAAAPSTPAAPGMIPAPSTPAMRPWMAAPSTPAASRSNPIVSPEKKDEKDKRVKHSEDVRTVQFVQCILDLPVKFHPSREYAKMYALGEVRDAINAMNDADSIEQLDKFIAIWESGSVQFGMLRDQFKEVAKSLKNAVANDGRALQRQERQAAQKTVVFFLACV